MRPQHWAVSQYPKNENHNDQGPVVQSIVSLTTSFRRQLVKYMWTTLSNILLFLLEKCENHFHNFLQKLVMYLHM